ncbi:MAG: DHH family phosphoesterase [Patescibacteria group bacterium]
MKSYRVRARLHDELLQDLLLSRGIAGTEAQAQFLSPDFARDSHDPFLLPDMGVAVERILAAVKNNEPVAVWSDYDADGIPGGVILAQFLRELGLSVRHYIPHRHDEGYGLNREGLDELAGQKISLVITVDLGTTEHENIVYAATKGIDVIVTDHHLVAPGEGSSQKVLGSASPQPDHFVQNLPLALAVINPKRLDSKYPFDGLCGAGVAWKLIQAILFKNRPDGFAEGREKWMLDLVGIATLSDMVPLVGENRMLARSGLRVIKSAGWRAHRPGLSALLQLLRINPQTLTEDDIGFMISPRINAASRMDSPELAARLLATTNSEEAPALARTLNALNDERKGLVAATVKEANKRLAGMDLTKSPLIVMGNPAWRPGILGLVANNLVETHGKPVFLWGREGGEVLRGSCRSDGVMNIVELMSAAGDVFDHFGGHYASGGFSVAEEKIHELSNRLTSAFAEVASNIAALPELVLDREVALAEVPHAQRDLMQLAPFGVGNEKPLFMFPGVSIGSIRTFGKQRNHLEFSFERNAARTSGIAFFATPESFQKSATVGERADVVGHIELDWRGAPRIRVVDII